MNRLRVATSQYYIRPVETFDGFRAQVEALVATAADYECGLLVFPEYFTVQLLTLGDIRRPVREQIRDLARQKDRFVELMAGLARQHEIHIVAGSIPVLGETDDVVHNESFVLATGAGARSGTKRFGPGGDRGGRRRVGGGLPGRGGAPAGRHERPGFSSDGHLRSARGGDCRGPTLGTGCLTHRQAIGIAASQATPSADPGSGGAEQGERSTRAYIP